MTITAISKSKAALMIDNPEETVRLFAVLKKAMHSNWCLR
jgi:hypothetical protein